MNTFFAASLFDSPWVILVVVLAGALSQWLMKRRQRNQADSRTDGDEPLPSPGQPQDRSPRELDLQEALRQLLGGEPPPRAPQPPGIPPDLRDAQPAEAWSDEEPFQPEQAWMEEAQETYEAARPPAIQTAPPPRPHPTLARASVTRTEVSDRREQAAQRFEPLDEQERLPATVVNTGRRRRSRAGVRAIALVRNARTVRQAFVASLVFGPPKALES
ncbi:MAG: hypothetical protein HY674_21465 [Chloroflexi bacterium]|nr:hypothetical protein [Chloroflexota bacterium]